MQPTVPTLRNALPILCAFALVSATILVACGGDASNGRAPGEPAPNELNALRTSAFKSLDPVKHLWSRYLTRTRRCLTHQCSM